jgi:hypothetical protein
MQLRRHAVREEHAGEHSLQDTCCNVATMLQQVRVVHLIEHSLQGLHSDMIFIVHHNDRLHLY